MYFKATLDYIKWTERSTQVRGRLHVDDRKPSQLCVTKVFDVITRPAGSRDAPNASKHLTDVARSQNIAKYKVTMKISSSSIGAINPVRPEKTGLSGCKVPQKPGVL
ncbi:hypothetical protein V5799_029085 [Amblyomma americanum]|uniref:Uncharacterized protein n=1 Tax=Amblyomma americanum TaxID=6943 RepID=A0AAQ4ESA4_AMBAM